MTQKINSFIGVLLMFVFSAAFFINGAATASDIVSKESTNETAVVNQQSYQEFPGVVPIINKAINICNFFDDTKEYIKASNEDIVNNCNDYLLFNDFFPSLVDAIKSEKYINNRIWGRFIYDFMGDIFSLYEKEVQDFYEKQVVAVIEESFELLNSTSSEKRISDFSRRNAIAITTPIIKILSDNISPAYSMVLDDHERIALSTSLNSRLKYLR